MIPFTRVSCMGVPSSQGAHPITRRTTDESSTRGISLTRMPGFTVIGRTRATMPTIIRILKMLLPTILPIAISVDALKALVIDTTSSGALVIIDTTVRPTMKSDMPIFLATATAPSVI